MIPVRNIVLTVSKVANDNAPTILTALAVAGVVSTTVMAVRATPEASRRLKDEVDARELDWQTRNIPVELLTKRDFVKIAWQPYIPAAFMGAATIACIISANSLNTKRNTALLGAYSLTENALREYRQKVVETIGEGKEEKIRADVIQDRITSDFQDKTAIIVAGDSDQVCYDTLTGRYFKSDVETIRRAVNEINKQLIYEGYASQNEFFTKIGLPSTEQGEELGWAVKDMLEVRFTSHLTPNERAVLAIEYYSKPIRNYWKQSHG